MAHLHAHSNFSVIDGRATIEQYLELAQKDQQKFFALTDHGTIGGAIELYTQAKKHHIKPVLGCELYVDAGELGTPANKNQFGYGHFTVLARNEAGYRALIAANNLAHRQFYQKPRISLQQIIDKGFSRDWIVLSGCMSSPVHSQDYATAEQIVKVFKEHAGEFLLEAMWHDSNDEQFIHKQNLYLERVTALAKSTKIPVVWTNDCHYAYPHTEHLHQDFLKIAQSKEELEFDGSNFCFQTTEQMEATANKFGFGLAVENSSIVGDMCNIVIPEADNTNWYVPDITGGKPLAVLDMECRTELYSMLQHGYGKEYEERYEYELSILKTSPAILNSYLVTHDVVRWCNDRGFTVAARGSMAGSLVSYLLGITKEDPIKYNLSFARAVNPARPSIPDFDLDVSSIHRQEVLDYLKTRYEGNIPICAYTHYGPKGAFRKVLRMEGLRDPQNINELCKPLPESWTEGIYEYDNTGRKKTVLEPWDAKIPDQYKTFVGLYEGLYSSMSVHPSGVLISGPERQLENEVPMQWIASSKMLSSAYDMYSLKKIGLFKLDVLGLKTLDQLEYMERVSGERVPDDNYDEPEVLAAFGADLLAEIFQMDGYACRNVIKEIRGINSFEDIIAANTLARPGASEFTRWYRSGYEGLLSEYASLAEILGPTNGLILYQEQVMEIARVLADFDDAEQDDVKESIKYFKHENWEENIAPKFRSRCEAKGIDATNILAAISRMASYTYNRAHAMTYAAIAYKMMWYKIHHPAIYYAAVFDASDDKPRLVLESHFFGVTWHPADVNKSQAYTTVQDGEILLGLQSIKGVGPAAIEALFTARPFSSPEDLEERVERRKCNIRVITALKEAFACSSLGIPGTFAKFEEAFGFSYKFLDSELSKKLFDWQNEYTNGRLAGFVVGLKEFSITKPGPNQGKLMGRMRIVNINGSKDAVLFPDRWKKARGILYNGAPVRFEGENQFEGGFVVQAGEIYND